MNVKALLKAKYLHLSTSTRKGEKKLKLMFSLYQMKEEQIKPK